MTKDLPPSWVERLRLLVDSSESPVVVLECASGDGGERLLSLWCRQGFGVPLRPVDLQDDRSFRWATEVAREIRANRLASEAAALPAWFVARSVPLQEAESRDWSKWLQPGERLIIVHGSSPGLAGELLPSDGLLVVPRSELALTESEALELFALRKARVPDRETLARLMASSGGNLVTLERGIAAMGLDRATPTGAVSRALESAVLEIELLGWPRLTERRTTRDGDPESHHLHWSYQSVLELLAALATSPGRELGRDDLLRTLWPDLEFQEARKQLYPAVSHLRKLLDGFGPGRAVEFSKGVYRLPKSWSWRVDVDGLERAIAETQTVQDDLLAVIGQTTPDEGELANLVDEALEQLEAGWRLVRGDFLQGFENDWVRRKRTEYRLAHQLILRRLACLLTQSAQGKRVEEVLRSLLIQDRLQEDAHLAMMRLYAQRGRIDLARRQYEKMSAALLEDVGVQPMDDTIREVERILASPMG